MHALNKLPLVVNLPYSTLTSTYHEKTNFKTKHCHSNETFLHCDQGNFLTRFVLFMMLHSPLGRCHHRDMHPRPCIFDSLLSGGSGAVIIGCDWPGKEQKPNRHPTARPQMHQWNTWHKTAPVSINAAFYCGRFPDATRDFAGVFGKWRMHAPFFVDCHQQGSLSSQKPIFPPTTKKLFVSFLWNRLNKSNHFWLDFVVPGG